MFKLIDLFRKSVFFSLILLLPNALWSQATPDNSTVGATTNYTFSMTLPGDLTPTGTITVTFPAGYVLPSTMIASPGTNINGGFGPATPSGQTVTFTRDGTGTTVLLGTTFTVALGTAQNPTAPSTYTLTVSTSGGTPLETPFQVTVVVGAISQLRIEDAPGGSSQISTINTTTDDDSQQFFAAGRDAFGNFVSNVSVTWGVIGGLGNVSPTTGTSTTLELTNIGSGVVTADDGSGHTDQTGQITVTAGVLASVVVVEGSGGDGPAFGTRTMTTDQTLSLHAAGYDADGNYTGDESVDWSVTNSIGTVSPTAGTSTTFDATTSGGPAGTVVATHATVGSDATGDITVNDGALEYVRINTGASGETSEFTTDALTTNDTRTVHASGYDADDNYISDVSVSWSVTGGIGTVLPASGVSTTLTATTPGTGVIQADHASATDDNTGTITVTIGAVTSVLVRNAPNNGGSEVGNVTITADQEITLYAAGYDAQNNFVSDVTVDWSAVSGNLAPPINGSGSSFTFAPTTSETSGIIRATHSGSGDFDNTGTISVNDGALNFVRINSGTSGNSSEVTTASLTTDDTLPVHASGYDSDGNYISDVSVDWSVSGGIGNLTSATGITTTLNANTVGTGTIVADHATAIDDATGTITVSVGTLDHVVVVEGESGNGPAMGSRSINTDQSLTLHAAGYDSDNNYVSDVSVTWSVTNNIGTVSPSSGTSTFFDPTTAGANGVVRATHATGTDDTGTITVTAGALNYIRVNNLASGNTAEVTTNTLTTNDNFQVHASGYDKDDNYISDESVSWSVTGGIGIVTPTNGVSTTLQATTPGSGVIQADHATAIDDATGTITVNSGAVASIIIRTQANNGGVEFDGANLTADESITLYAASYDAADVFLGDVSVTWSAASGNLAPTISGTGASFIFNPTTAPASGVIRATHTGSGSTDDTGTISVAVGALVYVRINDSASGNTAEVTTNTLTTNDNFTVHASGYDNDDNYIGDQSVGWSVSGGIGTLNPSSGISTTLTATTPGTGVILADHPTARDDATGTITVNSGAIASIIIRDGANNSGNEVTTVNLTADQSVTLYAASYDAASVWLGDVSVNWSAASGNLAPTINGTGSSFVFSPTTAPASGVIRATHSGSGSTDDTGTINVAVGNLTRVKVLDGLSGETSEVPPTSLSPSDQFSVHAGGFDSDDNYINDQTVTWSVTGGIGTVNPSVGTSTTLTATTPGSGIIQADHASVIDGSSGLITVSIGNVDSVVVRTASNNGGIPFSDTTLTADQSVTLYAAGYDAGDNYVADVPVTWRTTAGSTLTPVNGSGNSFTFSPTTAPATGQIIADHSSAKDDTTGTIDVIPGVPVGDLTLVPVPDTLAADGVSTSTITSSTITDSENNPVGSGRLFTVSLSPSGIGTITDPDLDAGRPGKQIATNASSQLSFTFQVGTQSGTAFIATSSVNGGASGDTTLAIGSLGINSISTTPTNVSRGQTGIPVTMSVSNQSSTDITNINAGLTFTGTVSRDADFPTIRTDGVTTIPAGQTVNLQFTVDVSASAALELITIDGQVSGLLGGTPASASGSAVTDSWTVQEAAQLRIDSVVTAPDTVQHGQTNIAFAVTVSNPSPVGGAAVSIDSSRLRFTLIKDASDQTINFTILENAGNPTSIAAQSSAVFNYTVTIKASADTGQYSLDARFFGKDINAANLLLSDLGADNTDTWYLEATSSLQIRSISPFPPTVTAVRAGQTQDWRVRMSVFNGSPDNVNIDFNAANTFIRFRVGANDVTDKFVILQPDSLRNSGTTGLASGAVDSLDFIIDVTGDTTGTATITGQITGTVVGAGGNTISDDTNDQVGQGSIQLTSSNLTVFVLNTNPHSSTPNASFQQAEVNTNQNFQLTVAVKNDLQEAVQNVLVELTSNGSSIIPQPQLTIPAIGSSQIATVDFNVTASGVQNPVIGEIFTSRVLSATGVQSQQPALIGTANDSTVLVKIQEPADLSLQFVPGFSQFQTAGEVFEIKARVANSGQANIGNTGQLTLAVPAGYQITSPNPVGFAEDIEVQWDIRAPATDAPQDSIFVNITQVPRDINIDATAVVSVSADTVLVQTLQVGLAVDDLQITEPDGSQDRTVSTEQNFTFQLDLSRSPNIDTVRVDLILPPSGLDIRAGEQLSEFLIGPARTTNDWEIRVGTIPLQDSLKVRVRGFIQGEARVDTTAGILVTIVERANLDLDALTTNQQGVNPVRVSTNQPFELRAQVSNGGTAGVTGPAQLTLSLGQTQVQLQPGEILTKPFQPNTPVVWQLRAPPFPVDERDISVTITAVPRDENTGDPTPIGDGNQTLSIVTGDVGTMMVDTVFVQAPQGATDEILSTDQEFTIQATVTSSDVRNAQVSLSIPSSYRFRSGNENNIGDVVGTSQNTFNWTIQAPNTSRILDHLVVQPEGSDLSNPDESAIIVNDSVSVAVVDKAQLTLDVEITAPQSALDTELTVGQEFTMTATLQKSGQAAVTGLDSVSIQLPGGAGYALVSPANSFSQAVAAGNSVNWVLRAPNTPVGNKDITFRIDAADRGTRDENTDSLAVLTRDERVITVLTRAIGLNVALIGTRRPTTVTRGASDLHLFGLKLRNTTTDNINLEQIRLSFSDVDNNAIQPNSIVSSLRVTDYFDSGRQYSSTSNLSANPVQLNFGPLGIAPEDSQSIQFLMGILPDADITSFRLTVQSPQNDILARAVGSQDFVVIRDDSLGAPLNSTFLAGQFALIDPELEASFFNYPNPFGSSAGATTNFNYNLTQDSEVSIRIYTLLGRLVRTFSFDSSHQFGRQGNHDRDIFWDGKNDRGDDVISGVYIAVITTNQGTAHTKIAVAR